MCAAPQLSRHCMHKARTPAVEKDASGFVEPLLPDHGKEQEMQTLKQEAGPQHVCGGIESPSCLCRSFLRFVEEPPLSPFPFANC